MAAAVRRSKRAPDPGTQCREWVARAEKGELPALLVLKAPDRGEEEPWFAEQILSAARRTAQQETGLDLYEADGGSPEFQAEPLENFLAANSLFGGERALILGRAGKGLAKHAHAWEQILQAAAASDGPRWMLVHLSGGTRAQHKKLGDQLKAAKASKPQVVSFRRLYADPPPWNPSPDASEAAQFVQTEARSRGLRLESGAAGALVQMAGGKPADLLQSLEHFLLLGLDRVREEDVREVAAHSAEGSAYEFAESVLNGDAAGALRRLGTLRARGLRSWDGRRLQAREATGLLLSVLTTERRRTALVRAGLDSGMEFTEACKQAGVAAGGPPAQRMKARLKFCHSAQLERCLVALRRADRRIKVESWRESLHALEELVLQTMRKRGEG